MSKPLRVFAVPAVFLCAAIVTLVINSPRPIFCPSCDARFRTWGYSHEATLLLKMRYERRMLLRVAQFYEKYGEESAGWAPAFKMPEDEQEVREYLRNHYFALGPRFRFVDRKVTQLQASVGLEAIRCSACRNSEVEVIPAQIDDL